jgi:FkbM family methyltransferase
MTVTSVPRLGQSVKGRLNTAALYLRASKRALLRRKLVVRVRRMAMELPAERAWAFPRAVYFERNVIHWFDRVLDQRVAPVVYDIGANCGYFALRAADRARAVYAFEPASETFEILVRNIERNRLGHVVPLRLGLADADIEASLYLYSSSGSNSLYRRTIPDDEPVSLVGEETIRVRPLDTVVAERKLLPPDVVKIDAEGSEPKVLAGAVETLRKHKPVLLVEHNSLLAEDAAYTLDDVVELLEPLGYDLAALSDDQNDLAMHPLEALRATRVGTIVGLCGPQNGK